MTFEEFASAHLPAVLRFAAVLAGDRAAAEDLAPEVLIRAYSRWDRIGGLDRPEFYVRKMILNEFLSWRRRSARQARRDLLAERASAPGRDSGGSMGSMTWLADGKTLAFNWDGPARPISPPSSLRLLDTRSPGHDLLASRQALPLVTQAGAFEDYTISPDGTAVFGTVVACPPGCGASSSGTLGGRRETIGSLIQFTATSGAPVVRYTEPVLPGTPRHLLGSRCGDPLWIGASGRKVLLPCFQHRPRAPGRPSLTTVHVVLLDNGRIRQMPRLEHLVTGYITAFPGITGYAGNPGHAGRS
jgi:hypothetical protein